MGELALAALSPHPPIIIPEVGRGEARRAGRTIEGMEAMASAVAEAGPDTVIVISPHAPVFSDVIAIAGYPRLTGGFSEFGADDVKMEFMNDVELAEAISRESNAAGAPAAVIDERSAARLGIPLSLDHGTMVPLYYVSRAITGFRVVPVAMGVGTPGQLYRFGMALNAAIRGHRGRTAVIASGDLSHRLKPGAPAGYDPRGAEFDAAVVDALSRRDPVALVRLDDKMVEAAGECGLRPIFMMLGAIDGLEVSPIVHSYEGPFGVGYAVATFTPTGEMEQSRMVGLAEENVRKREQRRNTESPHVGLARRAVEEYVMHRRVIAAPDLPIPEMQGRAGTFCSIHKGRDLRGCIGTTEPAYSNIAEEIIHNTISAATRDPRFNEIEPYELDDLVYSVDVLDPPEPIRDISQLNPERYGVIVRRGHRVGLLLPNLEGINGAEEQVSIARRKAGIAPDEPVELERFEVTRYE